MTNIKKIVLIKGSDGRYILSKEAVSILKRSQKITVSYNKKVPSECYIMADYEKLYGGELFEISYILPINVLEQQYQFRTTVSCTSKHPMQELIKNGSTIVFIPSIVDELQQTIRYMINTNGKISMGIFEQRIFKPETKAVMINKPED